MDHNAAPNSPRRNAAHGRAHDGSGNTSSHPNGCRSVNRTGDRAQAQPNALRVAWSILLASRKRRPDPQGDGTVDHRRLASVLSTLRGRGIQGLTEEITALAAYRDDLATLDPDLLSRDEAFAYWVNLYNAGALHLAAEASTSERSSVLRIPGGFRRTWATVAGETLSLDDIEHGKVRRFGDPRIHGALVCGSASCPTLRYVPFSGTGLDEQLEAQMRSFLAAGGARTDRGAGTLALSRIFLWYGGDFARPSSMPTWLPPRRRRLAAAVSQWLPESERSWVLGSKPKIEFAAYDWALDCSIA